MVCSVGARVAVPSTLAAAFWTAQQFRVAVRVGVTGIALTAVAAHVIGAAQQTGLAVQVCIHAWITQLAALAYGGTDAW